MALRETFATPVARQRDQRTGRLLEKVTCWDECHCVATYVYHQAMSDDERFLVFGCDRTGRFELYRLDLHAQSTVQLTEHDASLNPALHENIWRCHIGCRGELLVADADGLRAIDLDTLEQRLVAAREQPDLGAVRYFPGDTPDGRFCLGSFQGPDGRSGLVRADLDAGGVEVVYTHDNPDETIGHVVPATARGVLASFGVLSTLAKDPQAATRRRIRNWKLVEDGAAEPFLVMPEGFRATHEYWGADGRLYYHRKTDPGWLPTSVNSVDALSGTQEQVHFTSTDRRLGHSCVTRDSRWMVCDVQDPAGNELYLVNLRDGAATIVCWPDTQVLPGNVQLSHAHPWFSPSQRHIGYTSDHSGKAAVFLIRDAVPGVSDP